jgi:y4mF family transcriptional regulator
VAALAKGATTREDRLIRRPNVAHALRAHLAEILQTPAAVSPGGVVADARGPAAGAARSDGPSRKARDIAAGVRTRAAGYAHLFDPVAQTRRASELTNTAGSVQPVLGVADLGGLVRRAREALGQSQAVLAAGAGVGRRFLSELEAGKPTLEIGKVLAVCQAAGVLVLAGLTDGG